MTYTLISRLRFWIIGYPWQRGELWVRVSGWWRRHWWPARIRHLDLERAAWKRWCEQGEACHDERMMRAWGVIANASNGDWTQQPAEWVAAAERWRDEALGAETLREDT